MEWFRWYHGAISDPKWPLIARKSGQNIGVVVSIWASLLEHASQEQNRGSVDGFNPEAIDALYGYKDETTVTVCNAMRNAGVINGENIIVSWEKRQPKRERDDDSSERVRRFREKQKANDSGVVHKGNDNETVSNATVTPSNAQNRTEQNREDKRKTYTHEFESFWSAYPSRQGKKVGKAEAFKEWKKATNEVEGEYLIARITELAPQYGDFPKDACRWLKNKQWEDEICGYVPTSQYSDQFAGAI